MLRKLLRIVAAISSVLLFGSLFSFAPVEKASALSGAATTLVEGFENPASDWATTGGTGAITASSDRTEGGNALKVAYSFGSGTATELRTVATPKDVITDPSTSLLVDLKGDGTYNTVYITLRDATGELFLYRVDAMRSMAWASLSIDLRSTPARVSLGNLDGVLDLPASLYQLTITRNGSQPNQGTALLDNFRVVSDGWSLPVPDKKSISAAQGESTMITLTSGIAGDYMLELRDLVGSARTFRGTAAAPGTLRFAWNGRSDAGAFLTGSVGATLHYDTTPNGVLEDFHARSRSPYFMGLTARISGSEAQSIVAVNSFLTTLDSPIEANRQGALMQKAYVRYAREEFDWNRIEPRKGYFNWAKFDQAVEIARGNNLEIIGKLVYSAKWASSAPAGTMATDVPYFPPANMSDYARYAAAVVHRYKDSVKVWEIWNEQNSSTYWKPAPNAGAYAEMLRLTHAAIKAEDPSAIVLTGGLVGFNDAYMQDVVAAGAGNAYDGLAIHTYTPGSPDVGDASTYLNGAESFLQRNNQSARGLWVTEVGWPTCVVCTGATTEVQQAQYLSNTYLEAAQRDSVRAVAWYNLVNTGTTDTRLASFGLTTMDKREKPAYSALKDIGALLSTRQPSGAVPPQGEGAEVIVDRLASPSSFTVTSLGGGSASLSSSTRAFHGAGSLNLDYEFSGEAKGAFVGMNVPLSGEPTSVSVWSFGDASNSPIYMKLTDAKGERFQAQIGHAGKSKWKRLTIYSDGSNLDSTKYGGDGKWDYPITVNGLYVYKARTGVVKGQIGFDNLSTSSGTVLHGTTFIGRTGTVQALYTKTPVRTVVATSDVIANVMIGDTLSPVPVVNKTVSLDLDQQPTFLLATVGVEAITSPTTYRGTWNGGDTHQASVQIYNVGGSAVRTLTYRANYPGGVQALVWDGRLTNGTIAPTGSYTFRVTMHLPDGRTRFSTKSFSVGK